MDSLQIVELIERKNIWEDEWAALKKELLSCKKCADSAIEEYQKLNRQIQKNNKAFENSFYDGSLIVLDPTSANRKIQGEQRNIQNGFGFKTCCDEHEALQVKVARKVKSIEQIIEILDRAK